MSTINVTPNDDNLTKEQADAQWAESFAKSAPVLDAVAQDVTKDMAEQSFVADEAW